MGRYDPVEFCGTLKHETDRAYLVYDGANEVWIPKSQVQDSHQIKGDDWEFVIPEWLAIEKGII
jgi:hypothetical protein